MNSNIYYFVLGVSIQGWPTPGKLMPGYSFLEGESIHESERRINRANPNRIGVVRLLYRALLFAL